MTFNPCFQATLYENGLLASEAFCHITAAFLLASAELVAFQEHAHARVC